MGSSKKYLLTRMFVRFIKNNIITAKPNNTANRTYNHQD
jgi:hypothetical protein